MANILDLITIGEKKYLVVDSDPSLVSGTPAEVGSVAVWQDGLDVGRMYLKIGPNDVDWDKVSTTSTSGVGLGSYLRMPIYDTNASGYHIDDTVAQNGNNIDVAIQAQPSRSAAIEYRIPNPGDAITTADFILSEGAQAKNGDMTFNNNVVVQGDLSVNGSLSFLNSTQTQIKDKLVTLNQGGGLASAGGSGIEFAEAIQATAASAGANAGSIFTASATGPLGNGVIVTVVDSTPGVPGVVTVSQVGSAVTIDLVGNVGVSQATLASAGLTLVSLNGVNLIATEVFPATSGGAGSITAYIKMSADRMGFDVLASATSFVEKLSSASLTASRVAKFADTSGTFAMRPDATPFAAKQIAYGLDANNLVSEAGFEYDAGTNVMTVGSVTISGLGLGVVHSSAAGVLSSSAVVLTSEVSGVLPVANGGTNSSTALNNARIMVSVGGAIVEHSAMVANQVYFGAASTGLPAQSANLFWDITNSRLGIGTITPSRSLDVASTSLFQGAIKLAVAAAPLANFEMLQSQVLTTNASQTPIASVAIPLGETVLLKAKIVGKRTGGASGAVGDSAAYERTAKFKNIGGTVTIANLQSDYTSEDQVAYNATMVVSGTNASIEVKGAANNDMSWTVTYEVISL
jgi:hypothetical protein